MSVPNRRVRILTLLQMILVLPPMVSGSICISSDGTVRPELGYCACAVLPVCTDGVEIGTPSTPECGPCRDEAFSAVRSARASEVHAPVPATPLATSCRTVLSPRIADSQVFWIGQPSGGRLPILRC